MDDQDSIKITISDYIKRLSKEFNIDGSKGLGGSELDLIALVKNCQFLYDKNLSDFKNIQKKNEAWESIASVFGVSVGEVQLRWKSMRDLYNKQKREEDRGANRLLCPYVDELKFLEPFIVGRRTKLKGMNACLSKTLNNHDYIKKRDSCANFDNLRQFVEHIKNSPLLYHRRYSGGSHSEQKINEWRQVAMVFGVPVKECLARWRSLRERYSRERRMKSSGLTVKSWELFDDLSFLDPHIKPRRRYNYTRLRPNRNSDPNVCFVVSSPSTNSSVPLESPNITAKKEIQIEEVEFFDVSNENMASPILYNEDMSQVSEITREENEKFSPNEDDLFGQTIAAELKKVTCPRKKIKLKAEIYRLLYEHS